MLISNWWTRWTRFTEGVAFSVRPPKKSWKQIANLSGGEKTLSSLSLVFALHHYKPTPLYVMDEIDAALDFKNVSIVANYIKERTKNAQFIIISLRNNMFELADRLVGIYKTNHCTKTVAINPAEISMPELKARFAICPNQKKRRSTSILMDRSFAAELNAINPNETSELNASIASIEPAELPVCGARSGMTPSGLTPSSMTPNRPASNE